MSMIWIINSNFSQFILLLDLLIKAILPGHRESGVCKISVTNEQAPALEQIIIKVKAGYDSNIFIDETCNLKELAIYDECLEIGKI